MKIEEILTKEVEENLRKIVHYIDDTFEDSCIHLNYGPESAMKREIDDLTAEELLEEAHDFITYEWIGLCGCGIPNATIRKIVEYLEITDQWSRDIAASKDLWNDKTPSENRRKRMKESFGVDDECDNPLVQFLAYNMDHHGFTEHGSSISGCWITDKGRLVLYVYKLHLQINDAEDEENK